MSCLVNSVSKTRSLPIIFGIISSFLLWFAFPGGGGLWQLMPLSLVPLLLGIRVARSSGCAALAGFLAGLLHYHLQMYWIYAVLGQYGGLGWFLSAQALFFLATYMGLYFAAFSYLAWNVFRRKQVLFSLLALPALWVGLEWVKGILFTGLPWMDLGYSLYNIPLLVQAADVFGHLGISYLIVFANVFLVLLLGSGTSWGARGAITLVAGAVLVSTLVYSNARLQEISEQAIQDDTVLRVGAVQGNIDQSLKWSQDMQQETVETYLRLTDGLAEGGSAADLVVWPETALPFYPVNNPYMSRIAEELKTDGVELLTGAPMYEVVDPETRKIRFYNSALLFGDVGDIEQRYDKVHLVPFGEYVPLKKYLPFIAPLVETVGDFTPGKIENPVEVSEARIGILICFESVFAELSRKWVDQGANVLVNLTNDAWYGKSSAPYHSLAMAVLRAVENRRALVRAANTGISAFILPTGEIAARSPLFEEWAGTSEVSLLTSRTIWVRWGYLFGPFCTIFLVMAWGWIIWPGRRKVQPAINDLS